MPWIAPDEMVYGLLGRGAVAARLAGDPRRADAVLLVARRRCSPGFPLAAFGLDTGLRRAAGAPGARDVAGGGARVPVGALARRPRGAALLAAALAVAVPGLAYSGLVMTEVLFYPLLVLAAWARGGGDRAADPADAACSLVARSLAVCATPLQAIVLAAGALTAAVLDAWLARSWAGLRQLWPAAAGSAAWRLVWIVWRLGSGTGRSAATRSSPTTSYSVGARRQVRRLPPRLAADPLRSVPAAPAVAALLVARAAPRRAGPARARVPGGRVLARRLVRARGRRLRLPATRTGSSSGT